MGKTARKIPQNLKPQASLKCIKKAGKDLCKEEEIYELCQLILEVIGIEYKISQWQMDRNRNRNGNIAGNSLQNQNSSKNKEKKDNAMCCIHDSTHKWKNCLDNWRNKSNPNDRDKPSSDTTQRTIRQRGHVNSTEIATRKTHSAPVIWIRWQWVYAGSQVFLKAEWDNDEKFQEIHSKPS